MKPAVGDGSNLAGHFPTLLARMGGRVFWASGAPVGVAVSGGADSTALAWLAAHTLPSVKAFVVDHGLRPESGQEADQTLQCLKAMGVAARKLTLTGLPHQGLQANARQGRYRALEHACAEEGIVALMVAHHENDQLETWWMRHLHGTAVQGQAGMAPISLRGRCAVLRPLLSVKRDALRAHLRQHHVPWCEDPSNQNRAFKRVALRQDMTESEKRQAQLLGQVAQRGAGQLDRAMALWLARHATWHGEGWFTLGLEAALASAVGEAPLEGNQAVQAVRHMLRLVGGSTYPPPLVAVAALMVQGCGTLAGARLQAVPRGWQIMREGRARNAAWVPAHDGAYWDGRWRLSCPGRQLDAMVQNPAGQQLSVGALGGQAGWVRSLLGRGKRHVPLRVLETLPALWRYPASGVSQFTPPSQAVLVGLPRLGVLAGLAPVLPQFDFMWDSGAAITGNQLWPS
ncbi:tRNA lysidine(34) synthetase TilS [Formicincola oecophyllae]|uniref:tRNA(Ile)-lysidine synthase n=1 Tax=Formicincola oecophyllae TaxID=2558361 RepID=A0A4Y6U9S1_9PROT|nr:tRNA lysidine(34) synthetase TilS [Formicincola oecophyllae]QDH13780.1 tRNA lysidine(34) synthetase TilS [Formicincola oecophyllae]